MTPTKPRPKKPKPKLEGFCGQGRDLTKNDLVSRLRAAGLPVCIEAAKLIERLRKELSE